MKRLLPLAFSLGLAVTVAGCWPDDDGPDYHGERADPPDLSVRQSPSGTVHVGDTVTFTAVFRDSLNPKWLYNWILNVDGAFPIGGNQRSIRWAPASAGNYRGTLWVKNAPSTSRATISFETKVVP